MIRRREFITLLGGAAAWPLAARAEQAIPKPHGQIRPNSKSQNLCDEVLGPFAPARDLSRCGSVTCRDDLAPPHHSITSSARASSVGGISKPNVLAVCRLMTNSNLVARKTGMSAGFSPLRMRPV